MQHIVSDAISRNQRIHQQLDGGQRGFQLMGGIGYELPSFLLGFFQSLGKIIEGNGKTTHFVGGLNRYFLFVIAHIHIDDPLVDQADLMRQHTRQ
ncbi:hypothetical protein SDC9_147612 [bioreactor metagenome]|uniref:Uncharacterized protein n=1 Tax=bioreactor metagenome TaxID=1076179 RepID=A0A645EF64_9ZZZZ